MTEVQLGECTKVNQYGLTHSQYHATVSDGDMARIVALACEGTVWQRRWGIELDGRGRVAEMAAPHLPPPPLAWLGDYNTGVITPESARAIGEAVRRGGVVGACVLGEDGEVHAVH